jgi:hypothetical protein
MELNNTDGTNDVVAGLSSITYNGTLVLVNLGAPYAAGNTFQLFQAGGYSGSFAALEPPTPGEGLQWDTSELATAGILRIESGTPTVPPVITVLAANGILDLEWPIIYTGWLLETQTNAANTGLSNNWFPLDGSTNANTFSMPIDSANGSVFFRLKNQ